MFTFVRKIIPHEKRNVFIYLLSPVRRLASKRKSYDDSTSDKVTWKVHICSENNFPTAAGLASSAAGYACLGESNVG